MAPVSISRRSLPLAVAGFGNAFGSCGFKAWAVLSVLAAEKSTLSPGIFIPLLAAVSVLPPVLLVQFCGFIADRMPKRYVIITAELLKLPLLWLGFWAVNLHNGVFYGYLSLLALLGYAVTDAFFAPAFYSVQPESFPEPLLSRICGKTVSSSVAGFIAAIVILPGLFFLNIVMPVLLITAAATVIAAAKIPPVISSIQRERELIYPVRSALSEGWKNLIARPSLWASLLGEVSFTALGITALPLLVLYCKFALHMDDTVNIVLMLLSPGLGFIIGSFCAGIFSSNKIEPGLIPLGAIGITVALPLLVLFPGEAHLLMINFPGGAAAQIIFHAGACFWAAFSGFSGGLLFIPLHSYILQRIRPERRGAVLAIKNAVIFAVSSITIMLVLFLSPESSEQAGIPFLHNIAKVPYQVLLAAFGMTVFLFTLLAMWLLPNFMLRFVILTVGHWFYRLRITGAENIPERGPALLLCNHVSAIDSILVSACTSRQIRFLLYDEYFSLPLLGPIARMTGFFKIPSSTGKAKSLALVLKKIKKHLTEDGLVCVFPEGRLTRNGLVGDFKTGYEKMLPDEVDVPIIPVNISFAWGSFFSNFFTRPGIRRKLKMPFFSAVSFGKPLPRGTSTFEIRQRIIELGAEASEKSLPGEVTLHHAAVKLAKKNLREKKFSDYGGKEYPAFNLVLEAALLSRFIKRHLPSNEKYVGTLLPNSTASVKALLAVMMADRIPVPLNYSTSQEVFENSLAKAGINMVITGRGFLGKIRVNPGEKAFCIEDIEEKITFFSRFIMAAGMLLLPTGEFMNMLSPLSAFELDNDAVLLFSSGSTGNPKGVRLSHHNLNSNARSVASGFAVDASDLIVGNLPLFHSFGLNVCFWMPLLYGVRVSYAANPLDASAVCGIISEYKATMLFATPSFLQKYLRKCRKEDLVSLRLIATGAEKLRDDIAARVRELTDGRLEVVECYGCTELSPVVSINLASSIAETGRKAGCQDSIGVPLENISVRILDPLTYTPVAPGEEGILCVKGSLVMRGYLNDDEATGNAMIGEYYKTGDIARMDKYGYIHICGRLSRFSKIAGEMVPHEMVEKIINELCACDSRAVAVGSIPDENKGEALLVLYTAEMPFTPEEIVDQLRERSISNLWIPKAKNFHKVDRLPLLGSGKLDLAALRNVTAKISREMQAEQK